MQFASDFHVVGIGRNEMGSKRREKLADGNEPSPPSRPVRGRQVVEFGVDTHLSGEQQSSSSPSDRTYMMAVRNVVIKRVALTCVKTSGAPTR
jgi:hypothetical protein